MFIFIFSYPLAPRMNIRKQFISSQLLTSRRFPRLVNEREQKFVENKFS